MPTEIIKLSNGVEVEIPKNFKYDKCKGCRADDIIWGKTKKNDRPIPIRFDEIKGWISHFEDCPKADEFRKAK